MKLWWEVLAATGMNLGALLWEAICRGWAFLRLSDLFAAIGWVLTLPYALFRKLNPEGNIELAKHAHGQSKAGALLIEMLFLPYTCYLRSTDGMGESEHDSAALRFWFTVPFIAAPVAIWLVLWVAEHYGTQ